MDLAVDRLQRLCASRASAVSLAGGLPSERLFPKRKLASAFVRALALPQTGALQYGWPEGSEPLRAWIAARLRARGASLSADDVIVTSGAQQAIDIAAEVLLGARGAKVGVDRETYPAALDLFRLRGARPVVDRDGVACVYAMPAIANPRGDACSPEARRALLALGTPIIEDDAYAELRFDGVVPRPLYADAPDRVWHVGSFSKTLCPGLRVGWLVPPRCDRERALEVKHGLDLQASGLGQAILEQLLLVDDFDARLGRARAFYQVRAERLLRALGRHLPRWRSAEPEGGFSIWAECDEPGDGAGLLALATEEGTSFDPGHLFRADDAGSPLALRLCFSAAPASRLDEAVQRLARSWDRYRTERDRTSPSNHAREA